MQLTWMYLQRVARTDSPECLPTCIIYIYIYIYIYIVHGPLDFDQIVFLLVEEPILGISDMCTKVQAVLRSAGGSSLELKYYLLLIPMGHVRASYVPLPY